MIIQNINPTSTDLFQFVRSDGQTVNALFQNLMNYVAGGLGAELAYSRVWYVDHYIAASGDGTSWGTAFQTITEAVTAAIAAADRGQVIIVGPGFYLESAEDFPEITINHLSIVCPFDAREQTVLFGCGTTGEVDASTEHLLRVSGGLLYVHGLTLFNYNATKASVYMNGEGGGYAAGGCVFEKCYFSPQAQDGVGYGFLFEAGAMNRIVDCVFEGTALAAIEMDDSLSNTCSRNIIENCVFCGTKYGIKVAGINYNLVSRNNVFIDGALDGEEMTTSIVTTAAFSAGGITSIDDRHEGALVTDAYVNAGAGILKLINPQYATAVTAE